MIFRKKSLPIIGLVLVTGVSLAQVASSDKLFASNPCMDGWAGCESNGFYIDVAPIRDSQGRPIPSNMRIGWFDLGATPSASPFLGLSNYGPDAPPSASSSDVGGGDDTGGIGDVEPVEVARAPAVEDRQDPVSRERAAYTPPMGGGGTQRDAAITTPSREVTRTPAPTRDVPRAVVAPPVEVVTNVVEPEVVVAPAPTPAPTPAPAPAPAPAVGCSDLMALEAPALMGRLTPVQISCLEETLTTRPPQTTKDKISRVLLINADASNNRAEWARLLRRHLNEIDRSDPDLCFQYAIYLAGGGVSRAQRVIRWADYALENKSRWMGDTFQSRVFDLYRLKAQAGNRLWEQSTVDLNNAADNREELIQQESRARGRAKTFALDWLDFARATGQDSTQAMSLCVSVAGNRNYCRDQ